MFTVWLRSWIQHLLDFQVAVVAKSALYQLHSFLEKKDLAMVTHTIISSKLDEYCNVFYVFHDPEDAMEMECISLSVVGTQ